MMTTVTIDGAVDARVTVSTSFFPLRERYFVLVFCVRSQPRLAATVLTTAIGTREHHGNLTTDLRDPNHLCCAPSFSFLFLRESPRFGNRITEPHHNAPNHTRSYHHVHLGTKPTQIMKAQTIPLEAPGVPIPPSVLFLLLPLYICFFQLFVFSLVRMFRAKKNCVRSC